MNKSKIQGFIIAVLPIAVAFLSVAITLEIMEPDVPVGSEWELVIGEGNPFEKPVMINYKVLDVKNDWVLYERTGFSGAVTDSEKESVFTWGKECVKGCE